MCGLPGRYAIHPSRRRRFMEQVAWTLAGEMASSSEPVKKLRSVAAPVTLRLEVTDAEVLAELRRRAEGDEREQFALAALRIGVLALRSAAGQVDAASIGEAGTELVSEVREVLSRRVTEMSERVASTLTQYLDPQSGALPQRLNALVRQDGELERLFRAQIGADDSLLAWSLASHLGEGSPLFKLLSPTDAAGLRSQISTTVQEALADQRTVILREFSLDQKDSTLSRMVAEFSLDGEGSAM